MSITLGESVVVQPAEKSFFDQMKSIGTDEDLSEMGFVCHGLLCNLEKHSDAYERLWVWQMGVLQVVTVDLGNGNAGYVSVLFDTKFNCHSCQEPHYSYEMSEFNGQIICTSCDEG